MIDRFKSKKINFALIYIDLEVKVSFIIYCCTNIIGV